MRSSQRLRATVDEARSAYDKKRAADDWWRATYAVRQPSDVRDDIADVLATAWRSCVRKLGRLGVGTLTSSQTCHACARRLARYRVCTTTFGLVPAN
jgi:hypothetical protein